MHWPFIGTVGVALSELKPGGRAEFPYGDDTRSPSVVCECGYVARGHQAVRPRGPRATGSSSGRWRSVKR